MKPMLATSGTEELLDRKDLYFEPKLDGIRALCYKKTKLKFTSRNDIVITKKYPEFDFFDQLDCDECIIDGEIVVYDEEGNPSFGLWAAREKGKEHHEATYVAFDILYYNGESLVNHPLYARKKILEQVVKEGNNLQIAPYTKNGKKLWKIVKEKQLEGVVAKKNDSSYAFDTRSDDWKKIKLTSDIDCVIVGYTSEKRALTSLALGLHDRGKLTYVGKVGTGFDEKTMKIIREQLAPHQLDEKIIETEQGVIPVEPVFVVKVNYLQFTKDKKLRAPVFVELREDKKPEECTLE